VNGNDSFLVAMRTRNGFPFVAGVKFNVAAAVLTLANNEFGFILWRVHAQAISGFENATQELLRDGCAQI